MTAAPLRSPPMEVEPQWTDYNGHLNMAYYNVLFDRANDHALATLGMNLDYVKSRRLTIYTAEIHVTYVRELHQGQKVYATFQIIGHDEKRLHVFQELFHEDGWLAATSEQLALHIDMSGPKVAPFPEDIIANVKAMAAAHATLPRPERIGKGIGIRRRQAET
jgi:acyl-CoA thioester hydrolase